MHRKYNLLSFYLSLFFMVIFSFSMYITINHSFQITLLTSVTFLLLIILSLTIGILGFKYKKNLISRIRSWATILFVIMLFLIWFLLVISTYIGGREHIEKIHSPDNNYTIDFYRWDAGAAGTFGVLGELDGLLFKKRIYYEKRTDQIDLKWINSHTIMVNNHTINLNKGETYLK